MVESKGNSIKTRKKRKGSGWRKKGNSSKGKKKPKNRDNEAVPITSENQITDGRYRGLHLKLSESPKMRPTGRKLREILFRILYRRIRAHRFLDLCAGAGTVGIGAISRGALLATMVERKAKNVRLINENMESIGIKPGHGEVLQEEYLPFLKRMSKKKRYWDVVYFGPPYDSDYDEAMSCFERGWGISPGGILVVEHPAEMFMPERQGVLKRWKVVVEDDCALSFFDRVS